MDSSEKNDPQNDQVWELLKNSRSVEAGPFFSRNVVREVRQLSETGERRGFFAWFRQPVATLAGAAAAIALLAIALAPEHSNPTPNAVVEVEEFNPAEEFADVDYLGHLMAVSDPAMLDDQAFAELF